MYLKSLELTGFKSFAEAKIEFPRGVTALVGPNGTGKSNVVDAILWVLGEQSTKTLRSERMEDVIFNGTETRKPLGMAEVSLVMNGIADQKIEGLPPLPNQFGDYHEVMITRRLYRNGDSEYLVNKTPCRLKDIRSLFLDTRAGSKGHTIIEQGRIEQILNASPQDRRELIEETAGIVRYKKQKAEALRKLDSTHQNLLRVRDIVGEVERQLNTLERQARQARAYQNLQQEARTLEVRLLAWDYRSRLESRAAIEAELAGLETMESARMAEQARLTCDLESVRLRMAAAEQSIGRIREEAAALERQKGQTVTAIEVERGRLGHYEQQRAQALGELERLTAEREQATAAIAELRERLAQSDVEIVAQTRTLSELEEAEGRVAARRAAAAEEVERVRRTSLDVTIRATSEENLLASLGSRREETRRRAERLAGEEAEIESQCATALGRLQEAARRREGSEQQLRERQGDRAELVQETHRLEERLHETDQLVGRKQEELATVESRLRALQGVTREEMGYGREGAEEATSLRSACSGVREAVAEWLIVPPELERAIEAVLGERMRAWLVESPADAREAIEFLKQKGLGRGAFVPVRPRWSSQLQSGRLDQWWPALQAEAGVVGRALDLVRASGDAQDALGCLLGAVVIVESLEVAVGLWDRGLWSGPNGPTLVTMGGEILDAAGVLTGGATGETGGLLQRRREIQELAAKREELARVVEETRRSRERLSVENLSCRAALQQLEEAIREGEIQVRAFVKDEASLGQNLADLNRRVDTIRAERRACEDERLDLDRNIEASRERLAGLLQDKAAREASLGDLSKALLGLEEESRSFQQRIMDARVVVEALRSRREHAEADLARLAGQHAEQDARRAALERQVALLADTTQRSRVERDRNEALLRELDSRAVQVRAELESAQEGQAQDLEHAGRVERELTAVREALAASREARTAAEIRRAEIKTHLATLEDTLAGTYQLSAADALALEPEPASEGMDAAHSRLADEAPSVELRERLKKIRDRLERMGPVNLAAIEEHRELEERHRFLTSQEQDLANSISALKEIIGRINRTTKQMFLDTFNELQQKFGEVFARFFPGGRAELVLTEPEVGAESDQSRGEEPGVDIVAQPPGKRLKSITMLSGGEKTLTAMALIFASFLIRPTPFCILDEIDAPLDEENIGRFTDVLRELAEGAQFLVITHNKRTMAVAESLFGVTMEEPGISKLVSVRLTDLQPA